MSKKVKVILFFALLVINFYSLTCSHYIIWSLSLIALIAISIVYIIQYIKSKKASKKMHDSNEQSNSNKNVATQSTNNTNNTYINFNMSDKDTTVTVNVPNHNLHEEKDKRRYNKFNLELSNIPRTHFDTNGLKQPRHLIRDMQEIKFQNITKRTNINNLFPLIVLDVETTGLRPAQCDIIEFSAIKYEADLKTPTSCMTTLLKSKKPLPKDVIKITHITDEMITDKPYFYQIRDSVNNYINGCNIVGHNTLFDLKFLYVNGINIDPKVKYYDTLKIAKTTLKKAKTVYKAWAGGYVLDDNDDSDFDVVNFKLDTLCEYYNIFRDNSHRSLSDCLATAKLLNELIEEKLS